MKKAIGFLVLFIALTALAGTALAEEIPVDAAHFPDDNFRAVCPPLQSQYPRSFWSPYAS